MATLPAADPERLRDAIRAVLDRQLAQSSPGGRKLQRGAKQAQMEDAADGDAAQYFCSVLEVGYLVASADGLADEERGALAAFIERATSSAIERNVLEQHFKDLEAASNVLGRRERLGRAAADFDDETSRREALGFAALVAIADGTLADPELDVLKDLGVHLGLAESDVSKTIDELVDAVREALGS